MEYKNVNIIIYAIFMICLILTISYFCIVKTTNLIYHSNPNMFVSCSNNYGCSCNLNNDFVNKEMLLICINFLNNHTYLGD
jgi:hypothetical protein